MHFVSNTEQNRAAMLKTIGVSSVMDLFRELPQHSLLTKPLSIPEPLSELEVQRHLTALSEKNDYKKTCVLGAGAYNHFVPSVIKHLLLRGEFFTAYTPYQPEVSQGTLQAIYEFQSLMCELTGMDVSNASMYDGSSALAEAMLMATNIKGRKEILVSRCVHPEYRRVMKTYADANAIKLIEIDFDNGVTALQELKEKLSEKTAGVIVQYPNFFGCIEQLQQIANAAHEKGSLFVVSIGEPTALGLLNPPGKYAADIVVGEAQSFGNAISFGGPYVGFMATKNEFVRKLPGRLVGKTVDAHGKECFVLTLQAREQHIRREKATSNICTNQALCALASTIYLALLGKNVKQLASLNVQKAHYAYDRLKEKCEEVFTAPFYNEFVIKVDSAKKINRKLQKHNFTGGLELQQDYPDLKNCLLLCVTEMNTKEEIDQLAELL